MSIKEFHRRKETQGPVDGALLQWISQLLLSSRKHIALQMIRHAKVVIEQCRLDGDGLDESNVTALTLMRQEGSARLIQYVWRLRRATGVARRMRASHRQHLIHGAAAFIQCIWRVQLARRRTVAVRQERQKEVAVIRLQSIARGYLARTRWGPWRHPMPPLAFVLRFKGIDYFSKKVTDPYLVMSVYIVERSHRHALATPDLARHPSK